MNRPDDELERRGTDILRLRYVAARPARDPGGDPAYGCVDWFQYFPDRTVPRSQPAAPEPRGEARALLIVV